MKLLLSSLLLLLSSSNTDALSSGAGGCARNGNGSVNGLHLLAGATTGPLSDFGLRVVLSETDDIDAGTELESGTPFAIEVGKEYFAFLDQPTAGAGNFRGFLFRGESPSGADVSVAITPLDDDLSQSASVCAAPVAGVTHTFQAVQDTVSRVSASIQFDSAEDGILFDVTAVIANRNSNSEYYWTDFVLNVEEPQVVATEMPTAAPVTEMPTAAPVTEEPSAAPVTEEPTEGTETDSPTMMPVVTVVETDTPTASPVAATDAPVAATDAPVTDTPSAAPVSDAPTTMAPMATTVEPPPVGDGMMTAAPTIVASDAPSGVPVAVDEMTMTTDAPTAAMADSAASRGTVASALLGAVFVGLCAAL